MQLQLALDVADRLHHALLVRGEPLGANEAARVLLATDHTGPLSADVLDTLVNEDHRFSWAGAGRSRLSLRAWEHPDPTLATQPFVVLDLETTGARPGTSKITEVGAVRIEGLRPVTCLGTLVNPYRPIPSMISRITGITSEMVEHAPRIEEVLPSLLALLEGAVVVAHNAPFDVAFLNHELGRLYGRRLDDGFVDTLPLARALAPGLPNYRLGTVADALGAPVAPCHRALDDAQATAHVFLELVARSQQRGATHIGDLRVHGSPSASGSLPKLGLTRDLPDRPGTFRFLGDAGDVLLVGHAGRLDEEVRSFFVSRRRRPGRTQTAVRLVKRIDWHPALSPLEALVHRERLVLKHRPPYNRHQLRPEEYLYIRAEDASPGLRLVAAQHAPRRIERSDPRRDCAEPALAIGPFRRPSAVHSALHLLRSCYPIKSCPPGAKCRPCARGQRGLCLSPCDGHLITNQEHDRLVTNVMWWLAGHSGSGIPDPVRRAEEVAWELGRQDRYEEARVLRESCDDLLSIRRSYSTMADASQLSFAWLWPQPTGRGEPMIRLNLVWLGVLQKPESLRSASAEEQIDRALGHIRDSSRASLPLSDKSMFCVPRRRLDSLLAVSRWFSEADHEAAIVISQRGREPTDLATVRSRLLADARALFAAGASRDEGGRPAG